MNSNRKPGKSFALKYKAVATHLLVGAACFYAGIGVGVKVGFIDCSAICHRQQLRLAGNIKGADGDGERALKDEVKVSGEVASGTRFPSNVKLFANGVSWPSILSFSLGTLL